MTNDNIQQIIKITEQIKATMTTSEIEEIVGLLAIHAKNAGITKPDQWDRLIGIMQEVR